MGVHMQVLQWVNIMMSKCDLEIYTLFNPQHESMSYKPETSITSFSYEQ